MKYLYLLLSIGFLYTPASAEIFWQVYITKNNDKETTVIAPGVEVATASVRLDLPGMPVKATIEPVIVGTTPAGVPFNARMLAVEFLDGTGAALGTFCADLPQNGGINSMLIRRYNMMYQIDLGCVVIPAVPTAPK